MRTHPIRCILNVKQDHCPPLEREPNPLDPNPFRYCAEYTDSESGQVYLRNRYYDPGTGRFTSEDPIRSGANWYSYCGGNPVGFVDPLGLASQRAAFENSDYSVGYINQRLYGNVSGPSSSSQQPNWSGMDIIYNRGGNVSYSREAQNTIRDGIYRTLTGASSGVQSIVVSKPQDKPSESISTLGKTNNLAAYYAHTFGIGISANYTIGSGSSIGIMLVGDDKGNIGVQVSWSNPANHAGVLDAGVSGFGQWTNAADIYALSEDTYVFGGSGGILGYFGGDYIKMENAWGIQGSVGLGAGIDGHIIKSESELIGSINIPQLYSDWLESWCRLAYGDYADFIFR